MGWFLFVIFLIYLISRTPAGSTKSTGTVNTGTTYTDPEDDYFNDYLEMDLMSDGELNGR